MSEPVDQLERADLCDLLLELGPDAPTLCDGWTTADLAAHLVLREHLHRWPDERRAEEKAKGLDALVARLRQGAPLVPWRIPRVRVLLNGGEYFVHHEDVRRANGLGRRADRPDLDEVAWGMTWFLGRRAARAMRPFGLELRSRGNRTRSFGSGEVAVLRGAPTEVALYLSGRRAAAEVDFEGAPAAVEAIRNSSVRL